MTVELGGFIGLAGLMVALFAWMRQDMRALREDLRRMEGRINDRFERVEARITALEHGQARIEERLTALEHGQTKIEERLTAVEHGQARLEERLTALEHGQAKFEKRLTAVEHG